MHRRRRPLAARALTVAVAFGALGTAFVVRDAPAGDARASGPRPARVAATPGVEPVPTTAAAPPTTVAPPPPPPLPQPQPPPANEYEDVPVVPIGEIEIPRIGLVNPVYEGVWLTVIDRGPGHWPGTADPGGWGNTVLAAHRATRTQPFRRIDELVAGDEIIVRTAAGSFTYSVSGIEIVGRRGLHIIEQRPAREITIFACHPPGSEEYRYVVHGSLVRSEPPVT